jgi:hypothetical protein
MGAQPYRAIYRSQEVRMESRLLHAIDEAVERALPAGWPRVPRHRLPACGAVRVRHAFRRSAAGTGPASYLAVAAVPPLGAKRAPRRDLVALVDDVLSRGASLLLLYDEAGDPEGWIHDHVDCPHPRFLSLACAFADDDSCTVEPTAGGAEPLAGTLFDLWRGELRYVGPDEGVQTVGLEIMKDECWHCRAALGTVTGLVFPDRPVGDWSAPDWAYFCQPLELATVPDALIPALSAAVDAWRAAGDSGLTLIRWRYSKTVRCSYWAAECPACGAFRGALPVMEARLGWLHDLDSRASGTLSYRPLTLDVSRQALRALDSGFELSPHARPLGWYRADTLDLAGPDERGPIAIVHRVPEPGATGPPHARAVAASLAPEGLPPGTLPPAPPDLGVSASLPLDRASATPLRGAPPGIQPAAGEVAARTSSGQPDSAGHLTRLGQILLPWRGRRRRL